MPQPKPETPRNAAGLGALVLNLGRTELGIALTFANLSGPLTAAHIHRGGPTEAGPVVQTICGTPAPALAGSCPAAKSGTVTAVWRIPRALLTDLLAARLYVNLHTALNPGGEIRGEVR